MRNDILLFRRLLNYNNFQSKNYIQDGLVFEVDGTDKRSHDNYCWVDKIGGIRFTNLGNVIEIDNGFRFNGTSNSILQGSSTLQNCEYNKCTIEVVLKSSVSSGKWSPVVSFCDWNEPQNNYIGVCSWNSSDTNNIHSIGFTAKSVGPNIHAYALPKDSLVTVSMMNQQPILVNKKLVSTTTSTKRGCFSNRNFAYIGGRIDGNTKTLFTGDIYAIRVYNRLLTHEEMIHNQQIDIIKYNI